MELLATVDWIAGQMRFDLSLPAVKEGLHNWPGGVDAANRKKELFNDRLLELAITRLQSASLPE